MTRPPVRRKPRVEDAVVKLDVQCVVGFCSVREVKRSAWWLEDRGWERRPIGWVCPVHVDEADEEGEVDVKGSKDVKIGEKAEIILSRIETFDKKTSYQLVVNMSLERVEIVCTRESTFRKLVKQAFADALERVMNVGDEDDEFDE